MSWPHWQAQCRLLSYHLLLLQKVLVVYSCPDPTEAIGCPVSCDPLARTLLPPLRLRRPEPYYSLQGGIDTTAAAECVFIVVYHIPGIK
ncbi:hypothetical protein DAEQUDRAFT_32375 [Daedalea quercina L-15889]|uniref:Secreted protein n=1 Tax=Daedalea quercina L-15889 TaxID=1314783 RepID=A0A165SQX9_9APHY|nr:hypothetical protein DAEQUDRAFT_32375 [Daedalea quercina L-15889]